MLVAIFAMLATVLGVGVGATGAGAQPAPDRLITKNGGGTAVVGSTLGQLTAQLGPTYTITDAGQVLVDLYGYEVTHNGTLQFYALAGLDETQLSVFVFVDPSWQTAESIGPESTIASGETAYGDATLNVSEIEGREFVRFVNEPDGRLFFRTNGGGGANVGIYGAGETTTMDYEDGGQIATIWVTCVAGLDCPPQLPVTGPAYALRLSIIALVLIASGYAVERTTRTRRSPLA